MNVLSDKDINKIKEKRDHIIRLNIKTMEKNTKFLSLFNDYYLKFFQVFGNDINKHLIYINELTNIEIPKAKYLHYLRSNFQELYSQFIMNIDEKEKIEIIDQIDSTLDIQNINTKSIVHYANNDQSLDNDILETESLLNLLALKKESLKELKIKRIFRFVHTVSLTCILLFILTII